MKHELSDIDSQKMNPQKMDSQKWDLLLNLLEHPEKYSEIQKDELLGDEKVNELYQQLVETRQSLDFAKSKEEMKISGSRRFSWLTISVRVTLSAVAVNATIGIFGKCSFRTDNWVYSGRKSCPQCEIQ